MIGLSLTFYLYVPDHWQYENSWAQFTAQIMLYYLILIFIRTIFLLSLSFIEYMFSKRMKSVETFPLVSIIVPCYNEEVGIEKAVESLKKIDYPNIEILIVDDGSKDQTFEIAKKLEQDYL
jgi:cellulose synthase/poly-beta-1,6-N-acetylglucosamine synthase-like glycosyltransferase